MRRSYYVAYQYQKYGGQITGTGTHVFTMEDMVKPFPTLDEINAWRKEILNCYPTSNEAIITFFTEISE